MKKESTSTFEVIGMLQMAVRAFEQNPKGKTELEKNAVEIIKESVRILSEEILDKLSVNTSGTGFHP